MASGRLYTYPDNFRAQKALIAAQYSGANVEVDSDFVFGETNRKPEFLKKFPAGKVPAFESSDGSVLLTESNAIAYYLSNETLRGSTPLLSAQVVQWISWADSEVFPASCAWVYPVLNIMTSEKSAVERGMNDVFKSLKILNDHLFKKTFIVGERITLADIVVFCTLLNVFKYALDEKKAKSNYTNVYRWYQTLANQPEFKAVVVDAEIMKAAPAAAPAATPAAAPEKKAKAAPAPEAADDDMDPPPEKESRNPFDAMPKGTFVMDEFKKVYSNNAESVSIPYFFEKFDAENYSIWFGEYKYNEELAKVFMSCNLITGMFQRLDKMRKQAFASCCLFGTDNNSSISGVWVWRGQDLAFPLSPDWQIDYESYEWTKLDAKSADTKALVEQYFSWAGKDKQGRDFNQGKIFK